MCGGLALRGDGSIDSACCCLATAHDLDGVPVRVDDARRVVITAELRPDPRLPTRSSTGADRLDMEGVDSFRIVGTETKLEAAGGIRLRDPERTRASSGAKPGSPPLTPVEHQHNAEGAKGFLVEALAHFVVPHRQDHVVDSHLDRIVRSYYS